MWDKVSGWLIENTTTELFAIALASSVTLLITICYGQYRLQRSLRRLRRGDHSELVVVQLNRLVEQDGVWTLMLRNLAGGGSLHRILEGNIALTNLVQALTAKTTPGQPQLPFVGEEGQQALHTLVNHVLEATANAAFPLRRVLLTVTCEDRRFLRRTQIRIFVMSKEDLLKFLDPKFCVRVAVEKPWQSIRCLALHLWAKQYLAQQSQSAGKTASITLTWSVELPVRDDYTLIEAHDVDWTGGMEADALEAAGLRELFQHEERVAEQSAQTA